MRKLICVLAAAVLGLAAAGEAVAQSGTKVPTIVNRPSAFAATPSTETRVFIHRGPGTAGQPASSGRPTNFATSPTTSREIRVFIHGNRPAGEVPSARQTAPRGFHTSPSHSREIRVFGSGAETKTPIFILAD